MYEIMTINDIDTVWKNCSEAIYSEQFFNYLIQYNGNLGAISEIFGDDVCVNRINGQYAVVYREGTTDILSPGFKFIPKCYGLMDVDADEKTGVSALRTLPGLELTGEDVIVGFLDTGIDYTLNMFRDNTGKTRIKYIWDQNENNMIDISVGHWGFGALYTDEDINYALGLENPYSYVDVMDENGHGTFLASVAAGRGVGIAENSYIAVVKLRQVKDNLRDFYQVPQDEVCYGEDDIMLAVRFLIEVAAKEGKPLVICLGIGTNQGAHEGKSLLEKYLTYVSEYRGICVVSAVGNERLLDAHFHGVAPTVFFTDTSPYYAALTSTITSNSPSTYTTVEISVEEFISGFSMELWSRPLIYLDVMLVSPTGEVFSGINPRRDGYYVRQFVYEGTSVEIVNVAIDSNAGAQMLFFRFKNVVDGIWQLLVAESESSRGEGFDAWLPIKQFTGGKVRFVNATSDVTICAPGSAEGVITAAAYNVADDSIYAYSSRGFNRQGYIKPDIAASGVSVIGAFAGGGSSREDLLTARSGSSVSSAVLSGLAALVLEWGLVRGNAPYISTEEIKQFFIQGAVRKDYLTYPNTSFGWGEVNLLNSFQKLRI
jgi:subtilisin family serine protease